VRRLTAVLDVPAACEATAAVCGVFEREEERTLPVAQRPRMPSGAVRRPSSVRENARVDARQERRRVVVAQGEPVPSANQP